VFVCHAPSNCFFFFVSRWNRAIFWPSVQNVALYKTVFFDFWFRPPDVQSLLPKICTKSPISWLVWQIDPRCLGLLGGIRRWPIQWNHAKCCGADPCRHGNKILHKIVYKSACMAYRPEMFGPTRGFSGMADTMEPCKMLWGRPLLPWQRHLG